MSSTYNDRLATMLANERKRSIRNKTLAFAAAIVSLLTVYLLVVPAMSMSGSAYCGIAEHEHGADCYSSTLVCDLSEAPDSSTVHAHDASCYEVNRELVCNESPGATSDDVENAADFSQPVGDVETADPTAVETDVAAHVHNDACYAERTVLVCGKEEGEAVDLPGHTHSDACYESVCTCTLDEHVHGLECYSNPDADLESHVDWEATLPDEDELTGVWADDVLAVADSQLGYAESKANYLVDEDGNTKGYTRYGAWYGNAYGDWCAMFVSFCLHYAGVSEDAMPLEAGCQNWIEKLSSNDVNLYRPVIDGVAYVPAPAEGEEASVEVMTGVEYAPQPGDLIFFNWDSSPDSDHVGLVYELIEASDTEAAKVKTIEGNSANCVQYKTYELTDESIIGYADLPENPTGELVLPEAGILAPEQAETTTVVLPENATEYDFVYEDENFELVLHVAGVPVYESVGEAEELSDAQLTWDQAHLVVSYLSDESAKYQDFSTYVEGVEESGELLDLSAFDISLYVQDRKLDLSQCILSVDIAPKESLTTLPEASLSAVSEDGEAIAPEAEMGVVLTAMQGGRAAQEPAEVSEEASAEIAAFSLRGEEDLLVEDESASDSSDEGAEMVSAAYGLRTTSAFVAQGSSDAPVLSLAMAYDEPLALAASEVANPKFSVQYYAYLERAATTGDVSLELIDTSNGGNGTGGNLPQNGVTPNLKSIYLEDAANGKKKVATDTVLTEVYSAKDCQYIYSPNISYFNRLYENGNYTLKEIWVLKEGKSPTSIKNDDWDRYTDPSIVHFTNRPQSVKEEGDNITLLIKDDTVIRLVFDTSSSSHTNAAAFHDYDITNGKMYTSSDLSTTTNSQSGTVYARTDSRGINHNDNYSDNGAKLAFGNNNAGTGLAELEWNGSYPNKYNAKEVDGDRVDIGHKGCTFGLATGLGNDGSVVFASGIDAADIFGSANAKGKTSYDDLTLTFAREGDTYTLVSVDGTNATGLQYFNNPQPPGMDPYTNIWTNNFWPMDKAASFGASGHDMKFGSSAKSSNRKWVNEGTGAVGTLPVSDDGLDHNSYFGMEYAVDFTLAEDYRGPLEYYFFGDDDMWVFLTAPDGTTDLVCDIGGVHSSVGEYVNLWDHIEKGSEGKYRLSFFYTERGASGSTCYMQFTLPSVSSVTPEQNTGSLVVQKQVTGDGAGDTSEEFDFTIKLRDADGNALLDDYSYVRYSADGDIIERDVIVYDGGEFSLRHGEKVVIGYLPVGTTYEIVEDEADGYLTGNRVGSGAIDNSNIATGSIPSTQIYSVVYENEARYELPDTGGSGVMWYMLGGFALVGAAFLIHRCVFRRRGVERT